MRIDRTNKRVYVRQSSLNDMVICPERSRLKDVLPTFITSTDATVMGTSVHHGIEQILGGMDPDLARGEAWEMFLHLFSKGFKETNLDPEKYSSHIDSMMIAFIEGIMDEVVFGGEVEWKFTAPLGMTIDGYEVFVEGTMDYIDPNGVIWDWKTSSRAYNGRDKQATSIQASVYALAAVENGKSDFPVDFRYGVMVRQDNPKAQIVYLTRTKAHIDWIRSTIEPVIRYALTVGYEHSWMRNDTSALCSDKWCSHWSVCKGAYLSPQDLAIPAVPVTISPVVDTQGVTE